MCVRYVCMCALTSTESQACASGVYTVKSCICLRVSVILD